MREWAREESAQVTLKDDLPKLKALCRQRLDAAAVNGDVDGIEDDS